MPFAKDTGKRENLKYCSLCFRDGELCYESMVKSGMIGFWRGGGSMSV